MKEIEYLMRMKGMNEVKNETIIRMGFMDIIIFGGDPYSEFDQILVSMCMSSGEQTIYNIKIEGGFKNLFSSLFKDEGENNRMPEVTFDDVLKSTSWNFDFNFNDLVNKLMYEEREGITYAAIICPICRKNILEDPIIILNEDNTYFCSECNILLWVK